MERTSVSSSNISAVGYDPETQTLEVEFRNGSAYSYEGVPEEVHAALLGAGSVGGYFNAFIKDRYSYTRV